ncbi:Predicted metal-dependent hydrolase, TIM-barrel fold [Devosia crocina]|uniref:Predicted metal-dependent hydrolase, TIM-barrel fold n=1 Tax=Devosia crocina TaxID=429728 RepID=A0A1I7N271_9HYPH|nr:amidohydrolase family protein [Devosia crocina]SFV28723.1 Predicted metal-dependent hydrolase, TIM-barrel fold [Devosia crocina]
MAEVLDAPLCLPPCPLRNPSGIRLPDNTCDTHFHVFAHQAPLASPRSYTPHIRTIDDWLALAECFNIGRGVLVQPSVYGLDNRVLLSALAAHGDRLRGIIVVPPETPDADLRRFDALGVRGIRFNLRNKSGIGFDALDALAPRMRALGWHAQFQVGPEAIRAVAELTGRHDLLGVIDHLAFMRLDAPGPALDDLMRALDTGRVYVKISAPYRLTDALGQQKLENTLEVLARCYPNRLLWATDWPHTELYSAVPEDDDLIALTCAALPEKTHAATFVDNAQALYFSH